MINLIKRVWRRRDAKDGAKQSMKIMFCWTFTTHLKSKQQKLLISYKLNKIHFNPNQQMLLCEHQSLWNCHEDSQCKISQSHYQCSNLWLWIRWKDIARTEEVSKSKIHKARIKLGHDLLWQMKSFFITLFGVGSIGGKIIGNINFLYFTHLSQNYSFLFFKGQNGVYSFIINIYFYFVNWQINFNF